MRARLPHIEKGLRVKTKVAIFILVIGGGMTVPAQYINKSTVLDG